MGGYLIYRNWILYDLIEKGDLMKTKCPKCQSDEIIQIIYGYPTSEAGEDAEKGFVRLGGCDINEDSPQWHCKNCGHDFRQRRAEGPLVVAQWILFWDLVLLIFGVPVL